MKVALAGVLITGAVTGLLLPDLDRLGQAEEPRLLAADSSVNATAAADRAANAWAGSVVLDREADGHFYAEVEVDGRALHMLVDTGASVVALTAADAEALGLIWDPSEVAPVAQGASGPVSGVNVIIPEMALGDHVAHNVEALIIPEGLGISLLGQSFLGTLGQVQMTDQHMIVGNHDG